MKLILDGPALVRGLVIAAAGHTAIEGLGWDTGLYLADGSNQDAIRIGPYLGGQTEGQGVSPVPPRLASAIALRDFAIFGNGQRSATGPHQGAAPSNQPIPGAPQHAVFGIALTNCRDVLVQHIRIVGAPCYQVMIANGSDIQISDSRFESEHTNQDGVHIDGPVERVWIDRCSFATVGDDAVALNAPEGFGGDIEDVHVTDCLAENSLTMLRVYTSLASQHVTFHARGITVSRCCGRTGNQAFNLGIEGGDATTQPDQIEDMLITGCTFTGAGFATLRTPMGSLTVRDCTYRAPKTPVAMIAVLAPGARGLFLANLLLLRTAEGSAPAPFVSTEATAPVDTLTLAGVRVLDENAAEFPVLPSLLRAAGSIKELRIESVDMRHIGSLLSPSAWEGVGTIAGAGLLATGLRAPDEKVADNTLYLSTAGALSVKLQGSPRRLALPGQA